MPASSTSNTSPRRSRAARSGEDRGGSIGRSRPIGVRAGARATRLRTRRRRPVAAQLRGLERRSDHDEPPPIRCKSASGGGRVVVFPLPAAPSISRSVSPRPAIAATTASCASSRPSSHGPGRAPGRVRRERAVMHSTRSASTSITRCEVSCRMWSGTSSRSSSGTHRARARSKRSATSSPRTPGSATTPAEATSRSTSPRTSALFHADRRAPRRDSTTSATASRRIRAGSTPPTVTPC